MSERRPQLSGEELLHGEGLVLPDSTVLHFWRWALGDLCPNSVRGVFSEWLVAQLLGIDLDARDPWAEADLIYGEDTRVEVKSAAYVQSWHDGAAVSSISWSRLKGRKWDPITGRTGDQTYNADVYVFCVQTMRDRSGWDALDLSQWRFYVLGRDQLEELNQKSISEGRMKRLTNPLCAGGLRVAVDREKKRLAHISGRFE